MSRRRPHTPDNRASPFELRYRSGSTLAATSPGDRMLSPELIDQNQRNCLLAAALGAVTERGYPAATVADIVRHAGLSRKTFYEHFANKQECVLASYDQIVDWLGDLVAAATAAAPTWPEGLREAVAAVLSALAADPRLAALCAVEIFRVDDVGFARSQATIARLAASLRSGRALSPVGERLPPGLEETLLGGAVWLVGHRLSPADPARLTELAPDITYFFLVPYLDIPATQRVLDGV